MPWESARRDPAYNTSAWRHAREACMRRANWKCELRYDGCQGAASQADHIYGLANDPKHEHLRAVCKSCHGKRTSQQGRGARAGHETDPEPRPRTDW